MPHGRKISRPPLVAATVLAAVACGGGGAGASGDGRSPAPRVPPAAALGSTFVLESSGIPPDDTTVSFAATEGRVVIVRRGAPDNGLFVEVRFRPTDGTAADSVVAMIRHRPGQYGIEISFEGTPSGPIQLTFSYGVHFVAPAAAYARFGTSLAFERALFVGRLDGDRVRFLASSRPGSDLLRAMLPGPGTYLVAAPRDGS